MARLYTREQTPIIPDVLNPKVSSLRRRLSRSYTLVDHLLSEQGHAEKRSETLELGIPERRPQYTTEAKLRKLPEKGYATVSDRHSPTLSKESLMNRICASYSIPRNRNRGIIGPGVPVTYIYLCQGVRSFFNDKYDHINSPDALFWKSFSAL